MYNNNTITGFILGYGAHQAYSHISKYLQLVSLLLRLVAYRGHFPWRDREIGVKGPPNNENLYVMKFKKICTYMYILGTWNHRW